MKKTNFHLDFYAGIFAVLSAICFIVGGKISPPDIAVYAEAGELGTQVFEEVIVERSLDEYVVGIAETAISEETIETGEVTIESTEPEPPAAYVVESDYVVEVYDEPNDDATVIGYISDGEIIVATPCGESFAEFDIGDNEFAYISLACLNEYTVTIQPVQDVDVVSSFISTSSINSESGLSEDEIAYLLKGSYMEDYAYLYYNAEKTHGINAYYMLAVSQLESGWGKSTAGMYYNNIFGLMTSSGGFQYFNSKAECVEYWLGLMDGYYLDRGLDCPAEIGPVYCTTGEWPTVICEYMNGLVSRVERYRQSLA